MGVDKSDIRTVIHKDPAPSVEAYLQESGRAGRDRRQAYAVLLLGPDEAGAAVESEETIEQRRYLAFIRAVADPARCRREALLGLLGARPETCFGCDVCESTVQTEPEGQETILRFVKRYPRSFTLRRAVTVLRGAYRREIEEDGLWRFRWFASLPDWTEECLEEAVHALCRTCRLKLIKHGPWKGLLRARNDNTIRNTAFLRL